MATSALPTTPMAMDGTEQGIAKDLAPEPTETGTAVTLPRDLPTLVSHFATGSVVNEDARCLATAVYYEAKGEPLDGQLAVARVILNRVRSGRFAASPCGVVKQPSQFSFVRRGAMPTPPDNRQWRIAVGIAQVAALDLYRGPAADALFFHARRVAPGWNKPRLAAVGNHIFYR